MRTLELKNFGEGEDLSDGEFSSEQNRFLELENYRITNRRRIQRRPPVIKVAGTFGVNTMNLKYRDGQLLTLIPRGAVSGIGVPTGVTTLAYDVPTGAVSSAFEDSAALGDVLVIGMRHQHTDGSWFFSLHVFDGAPDQFTYTTDPAFPWWHTRAATSDDLPRMVLTEAASKIWVNGPDGDTHGSGVANARKWNKLTLPELLAYGYQFHYYNHLGVTSNVEFTVPLDYAQVQNCLLLQLGVTHFRVQEAITAGPMAHADAFREDKWGASAIVGDNFDEVIGTGNVNVADECAVTSVANGAATTTYANWTKVVVRMEPGRWYRFCWTPPNIVGSAFRNYIESGTFVSNGAGSINTSTYQLLLGDGVRKEWELDGQFVFTQIPGHWSITKNGVAQTYTTHFTIQPTTKNKCKLVMVTAPASGDALDVRELLVIYNAGTTSVVIPPGQVNIGGVVHEFQGQVVGGLPDDDTVGGPAMIWLGLSAKVIIAGSATPAVAYTNVSNQYALPAWDFIPLLSMTVANPANPIIAISFSLRYTPNARQESSYQDAQDYAGSTATERDTVTLPTSSHDTSGGIPTLLVGVKNRLLVGYTGQMQLWSVNEDANADTKLSISPFGTGAQAKPHGVQYAEGVMVPLEDTYFLVGLGGDLSDKLSDDRVGEKIERFGVPNVLTAAFWPKLGEYIAAEIVDGEFRLRVLDLHKSKDVAGWSRWTMAGITTVDYRSMIPVNDRLYFRSGDSLYYLDAGAYDRTLVAGTFRDSNDAPGAGNAYRSRAVWRFNDFKKPGVTKDVRGLHVVQTACGRFTKDQLATADFSFRPYGPNTDLIELGPTITGSTYGKDPCDLSMETDHLSVVMESTDELGHELQALAILFDYQEE